MSAKAKVSVLPWTCVRMHAFLARARRGESAIYHVGRLATDRRDDRQLAHLADALFRLSEAREHIGNSTSRHVVQGSGALYLTQTSLPSDGLLCRSEYRLTVRRRPLEDELARAFAAVSPAKRTRKRKLLPRARVKAAA